jgi:ABC-type sugar transport system substrate-binding protein
MMMRALTVAALLAFGTPAHAAPTPTMIAAASANVGNAETDVDVLRREIITAQKVQDDKLDELRREFQTFSAQSLIDNKNSNDARQAISERVTLIDGINAKVDGIVINSNDLKDRVAKIESAGTPLTVSNAAKIEALQTEVGNALGRGQGAEWLWNVLGTVIGIAVGIGSAYAFLRRPRLPLEERHEHVGSDQ